MHATATDVASTSVGVVLAVALGLIVAVVATEVVAAVVKRLGRNHRLVSLLAQRVRLPLRAVLIVVALWVALRIATPGEPERPEWMSPVQHALLIALILTGAWLIGGLAFVVEDVTLTRFRTGSPDDRQARRIRTQVSLIRRLTVAILAVLALGASLLTFDEARHFGAAILTSAGLLSVVAGLAAQSSLANVFAGVQLAFTDAIRLDDVVVVNDYWGRIEEITLTYVVVHVWDDRRLILPSTFFTTTPFENWTRRAADLLGTVELDVDWSVPVGRMRAELMRVLRESELWDHRVGVLQVTDAVDGKVRIRALASAVDAPTLWDLRCAVREGLVTWLQSEHPESLPRIRLDAPGAGHPASPGAAEHLTHQGDSTGRGAGLFTGNMQAVERSRPFSGPGEDAITAREHHAEGLAPPPPPGDDSPTTRIR